MNEMWIYAVGLYSFLPPPSFDSVTDFTAFECSPLFGLNFEGNLQPDKP